MSEPISTAYTQEQMLDRARGWVRTNVETKEQRFIVLGILVDFIMDHFPKESKDTPSDSERPTSFPNVREAAKEKAQAWRMLDKEKGTK